MFLKEMKSEMRNEIRNEMKSEIWNEIRNEIQKWNSEMKYLVRNSWDQLNTSSVIIGIN